MENWKSDFYSRYSTWFGKKYGKETFKEYFPFGSKIVKLAFPGNKDAVIMDMGCGTGGFVYVFQQHGYINAAGVDYSQESVEVAVRSGVKNVHQGDLNHALDELHSGSVDVILFLDVLEHFHRDETLKVLDTAFSKLKPDGKLVIHVPNAEGIFGNRIRYSDITHEQAFTAKSIAQMLRYAGFSKFRAYEDKPIVHSFFSFVRYILWTIMTLPYRILHGVETGVFNIILSQNLLIVATKG